MELTQQEQFPHMTHESVNNYVSDQSIEKPENRYVAMNTQDMEQQALKIANVLQTSLDLNKLIEMFDTKLGDFVEHEGIIYDFPQEAITLQIGSAELNTCSYKITLLEKSLGELTISRSRPFTDEEVRWFESLLCALIYPLHNALLYKKAIQTAYNDPVTGVNNRAAMDAALDREVELAMRNHTPLSVIMLDIDHFKKINDKFGHIAGDAILKGVGRCLTECIRRSDIVFRYGGEEFAVLLNGTDIDGANFLANRIRSAIEKRAFKHDGLDVNVTLSAGVARLEHGFTGLTLIDAADQALYQAKEQGRNRVVVYQPGTKPSADDSSTLSA